MRKQQLKYAASGGCALHVLGLCKRCKASIISMDIIMIYTKLINLSMAHIRTYGNVHSQKQSLNGPDINWDVYILNELSTKLLRIIGFVLLCKWRKQRPEDGNVFALKNDADYSRLICNTWYPLEINSNGFSLKFGQRKPEIF